MRQNTSEVDRNALLMHNHFRNLCRQAAAAERDVHVDGKKFSDWDGLNPIGTDLDCAMFKIRVYRKWF